MELELEPRVKPLAFKVKAMSRESPSQKAAHVLDPDLRNHWSTGTNTKEWILLELDEPCLLSHVRIYNKSVLEWEISVGLRFKPDTFVKVRPRSEAPRRDMTYPTNYTPCRYVRISCLRGNPIAIFFIQLIGVSVSGLEPEFQPVVNYLLPHIMFHKQDAHDMHLQILQDMTDRLGPFLPQLETDLNGFPEAAEATIRFLAMLAGPFYPILHIVHERETARLAGNISDSDASKNNPSSTTLTVSSNFEPRRSRYTSSFFPTSSYFAFRPDTVFILLRKAYKDPNLGAACRMASRILLKLVEPVLAEEGSSPSEISSFPSEEFLKCGTSSPFCSLDYSNLFGEEFLTSDYQLDVDYLNVLDIGLVEEGIFHVLFACASRPQLCSKVVENATDFWLALPLVQALLPALRPNVSVTEQIDDSFSQWKQPFVQHALSQIVGTSSSSSYRPLLRACAGYLASFSPSHAKAACVLIDLCSGVLAPWLGQVIAKVDLTVEILEDLLPVIQGVRHSVARARAALKYIALALSGHMDDIMAKYKDVKHRILFLVEMLEPYLYPAINPLKSMIAFGNMSSIFLEREEHNCAAALNVIHAAFEKAAVLPSLETEWKLGTVPPSVLLTVLGPHVQLPHDIDQCKFHVSEQQEPQPSHNGGTFSKSSIHDDADGKTDMFDMAGKMDIFEDASLLFAPVELKCLSLINVPNSLESNHFSANTLVKDAVEKDLNNQLRGTIGSTYNIEYSDLQVDYLQLVNYRDSELRASEFKRLALDLHSQNEITSEGHDAAIDALLLSAECYVNPYFIKSLRDTTEVAEKKSSRRNNENSGFADLRKVLEKNDSQLKMIADLEMKRDKIVLEIMLEAAELDKSYRQKLLGGEHSSQYAEENDKDIDLSQQDMLFADAITLVRKHQALLCNFLIERLQRENHSIHEILLQTLLFLLNSATKLNCDPELLIGIILKSAESFSSMLRSFYYEFKEGSLFMDQGKLQKVQRHWSLLQRLIIASSGSDDEGSDLFINVKNGLRFANLVPPSAWLMKISSFSSCSCPLVRFLGWMAVSRNAKQYKKERLFLASDLSQLTCLLQIFADELSQTDDIIQKKDDYKKIEDSGIKQYEPTGKRVIHPDQSSTEESFHVIYPDIGQLFPSLKKEFQAFSEAILEAVALQLRSVPSALVPDLMCWFSDLCLWPFVQKKSDQSSSPKNSSNFKGFAAKNAKAIILYILEAIVAEHMESLVPEIPRAVQVLVSLCKTSYCDVSFLNSVLLLLKPIISYSLNKVSDDENLVVSGSCSNFESLCFSELFGIIKPSNEHQGNQSERGFSGALTIFVLASIFPDLTFSRKIELLQSSSSWADFVSFEPSTSLHDYLCAYQALMQSCKVLLVETSRVWGVIPIRMSQHSDTNTDAPGGDSDESCSYFLADVYDVSEKHHSNNSDIATVDLKFCQPGADEIGHISEEVESLISRLSTTIDQCSRIHHKMVRNLSVICAECFVYARFLSLIVEKMTVSAAIEKESPLSVNVIDQFPDLWRLSLEGLAEMIIMLQEHHHWEVASVMFDCLLGAPRCFTLDNMIGTISAAIRRFAYSAPNIVWRLQSDNWLSSLLARGIYNIQDSEIPLLDLFSHLLGHPEPEQRFIALKNLGKLVSKDLDAGIFQLSAASISKMTSIGQAVHSGQTPSSLVSSTWDQVALLASSDSSQILQMHAMALLVNYVPFADQAKLQSFLTASDSILHYLTRLSQPTCEGPLTQLSLALIASVCLYSPAEDISLIPENVWENIEAFAMSGNGRCSLGLEKRTCQALCAMKDEGNEAKEILREAISSTLPRQLDPGFGSTRESILQVISNLTSAQSYYDMFSRINDQKNMELEEAEMEMELLQKEHATQESCNDSDWSRLPFLSAQVKDDDRLKQIKDEIRSLEKAKLREQIIERRQKKLLIRHARQKYLEEASTREAALLQELDRERATEAEREIERQQLLELERAKTRELRHNLDIEKEKQAQRDLQRELEQVESGIRPSRREFSSSTHSRPRDRYRERENGRAGTEASLRTNAGVLQPETAATSSSMATFPTVVLSGTRQFTGQPPTILQSRERSDECGSSYEENFDGSKDSGDTGSVGDPDLVSALEGQSSGFGSASRHGSRGSKSRQIMERRERDSRREGKWERKH